MLCTRACCLPRQRTVASAPYWLYGEVQTVTPTGPAAIGATACRPINLISLAGWGVTARRCSVQTPCCRSACERHAEGRAMESSCCRHVQQWASLFRSTIAPDETPKLSMLVIAYAEYVPVICVQPPSGACMHTSLGHIDCRMPCLLDAMRASTGSPWCMQANRAGDILWLWHIWI
jgi:hypothetical protein